MWYSFQELEKIIDIRSIGLGCLVGSFLVWLFQRKIKTRFEIQPRLTLRIDTSTYQGGREGSDWEAGWGHYVTIQNDSKFDAYHLTLHFAKEHEIFTDLLYVDPFAAGQRVKLSAGQTLHFMTKTLLTLPLKLLYQCRRARDNHKEIAIIENLTPKGIRDVKIYLRYENELGQVFYVRYCQQGTQTLSFFKPLFW
ncbi:MAG: hypothetical protein LH606_19325 [Cytophagaceae bacterium]|nr:hypothetical protein [Cytophagaceae bacterium]